MYTCEYCKLKYICPRGQNDKDSWCPNFTEIYKPYPIRKVDEDE